MFGREADKVFNVYDFRQFVFHRGESGVVCDSFQKVVFFPFDFHSFTRFHAVNADFFVQFLTVSARFYAFHKDILCCHKRKFGIQAAFYHVFVHDEI